ncbi:hypothetical protein GCM10028773_02960 [Spirosoma koreense]
MVGKWTSAYVLASGYVAPYTSKNGEHVSLSRFGINDGYDIKNDKTFIYTDRTTANNQTLSGTWNYSGTQLILKANTMQSDTLTYDGSAATPLLLSNKVAVKDSLVNPTTNKKELVQFNLQLVYSK